LQNVKLPASGRPWRAERSADDRLWCEWTSTTHALCYKIADPGFPFCLYHCAAVLGMARGASTPDAKTRALFDEVIDYYDEHKKYELWVGIPMKSSAT
jgi:hypothetical protein